MIKTLCGKNEFELKAELKKNIASAKNDYGDYGVEQFDGSESSADEILQAAQSIPFLAEGKLVVINNAAKNNELMERIEGVIERTPDSVDLVIVGPEFDKRKSSFKLLKQKTDFKEFGEPSPYELPKWVQNFATSVSGNISLEDSKYLVDRVGVNQMLLAREIEKLVIFNPEINKKTIKLLTDVSAQSSIFNLLDAAFNKEKDKAVNLYRKQRKQKVEPQYIIAMLTWQLHSVAQAVFAEPQNEATLRSMGQSSFTASKSLNLARKIGKQKLKKLIIDLSELDAKIKTTADADSAVELYLLEI